MANALGHVSVRSSAIIRETVAPAPASEDEPGLVRSLQRRDPRALAKVDELYGSVCFGFLLNTLRDRADAEDVHQQVFLEVWQRAPTYDPQRGRLLTWILMIARSRAIDHLRRRVPEPIGTAEDADAALDDEADRAVERWHIAGLLRQIPAEEATILRMRFHEDLTQVEIAARLDMPLGTVKSRMASGLRRLRTLMEERS